MTFRALHFDLPDLRLVVAIAEAGSLGKAALALPLALSAASARLKLLEHRLGTQLFERSAQGAQPTPPGRQFLDYARRILRAADEAQEAMDAELHDGRETLRLWSNSTGLGSELPTLIAQFLRKEPRVDLLFREASSRACVQALKEKRIDLGVIDAHYLEKTELLCLPFRRDKLVVLLAAEHDLATRDSLAFAELARRALVMPPEQTSLRQFLEKMALLLHIPLRVRAEAPGYEALAQLVASDVGLGIVPEATATIWCQRYPLAQRPLTDDWAVRELHLAVPALEELKPATRRLLNSLNTLGSVGA